MYKKKPQFPFENHSVISLVTELHRYFRDFQSYCKVAHGEVLSQLESTNDEQKSQELKQKLRELNEKTAYFHVLNNAVSIADTVLHTEAMIAEFGSGNKVEDKTD
ncbi:MAG: hypothetical protein AB4426_00560 [Xenococcaceae cyanobacterium]